MRREQEAPRQIALKDLEFIVRTRWLSRTNLTMEPWQLLPLAKDVPTTTGRQRGQYLRKRV